MNWGVARLIIQKALEVSLGNIRCPVEILLLYCLWQFHLNPILLSVYFMNIYFKTNYYSGFMVLVDQMAKCWGLNPDIGRTLSLDVCHGAVKGGRAPQTGALGVAPRSSLRV